jgi:hypothetical protein
MVVEACEAMRAPGASRQTASSSVSQTDALAPNPNLCLLRDGETGDGLRKEERGRWERPCVPSV